MAANDNTTDGAKVKDTAEAEIVKNKAKVAQAQADAKPAIVQAGTTDTAQTAQGLQVGANTANVELHPSLTDGVTDKGGVNDPVVQAQDVKSVPLAAVGDPAAPVAPTGTLAAQVPVAQINTPEAARTALQNKVSLLHKLVSDVGHISTLAVDEVEALVADIKYLVSYVRTKV